jgi:hypothetical protein
VAVKVNITLIIIMHSKINRKKLTAAVFCGYEANDVVTVTIATCCGMVNGGGQPNSQMVRYTKQDVEGSVPNFSGLPSQLGVVYSSPDGKI